MSDYVQTTFFTPKDSLPPSDPNKTIFGSAYDVEFGNIASAIASKLDTTTITTAPTAFYIGTASLPGITFVGHTGTGLYSNAGADLGLSAGGASRLVISGTTGGSTFATPVSGVSVAVNGFNGSTALTVQDSLIPKISLLVGATERGFWQYIDSSAIMRLDSDGSITIAPNNTVAMTLATNGTVVIAAPSSGVALTAGGTVNGTTAAQLGAVGFSTGTNFLANHGEVFGAGGVGLDIGTTGAQSLGLWTSANQRMSINSTGNIVVAAPASGDSVTINSVARALVINGTNNANTLEATGGATSGQSFGLYIHAGTTAADANSRFTNQANTQTFVTIDGVGNLQLSNGTGAIVGPVYAGAPQQNAPTSGNYQLVLADANRFVSNFSGSARNVTIPANGTVAFPIGTMVTFVEGAGAAMTILITTDTLQLANSASTGTRTLAANGVATAIKTAATTWYISGTGLT